MVRLHVLILCSLGLLVAGAMLCPRAADAAPMSVSLTGNLQTELGCSSDFQPDCTQSALEANANDGVFRSTFSLPAGVYAYGVTLDGTFAGGYGRNGLPLSSPVSLRLPAAQDVRFYYDPATHWVTDSVTSTIATLAGSFQSELGCAGDFDPGCLLSWLKDVNGTGTYDFTTGSIPVGRYETIVAINESFDETYGLGGAPGASIPFSVPFTGASITFRYNPISHDLTIIGPVSPVPLPGSAPLFGAALLGLAVIGMRRTRRTADAVA